MSDKRRASVAFHTLGCKVNQHDTAMMAGLFQDAGYDIIPFDEKADVYVINTCTVTHLSDRKSRQMIRRAASNNEEATVVVCGCYAQTAGRELLGIDEVDLILGTNERHKIVQAVEEHKKTLERKVYLPDDETMTEFEPLSHNHFSTRTRASIKVQEGCDQFCSYCIIPYARGPLRSRKLEETLDEIRTLIASGHKEVVLTGIHLGAYGKGIKDEKISLDELCEAILDQTDLPRLRLGSVEVTEITDKLIDRMQKDPRLVPHLHLPLQSGSDRVLARMERPYDTKFFRDVVRKVRGAIPRIAITTDVMVGFPGESDNEFKESLSFANDMAFSDMHIFKYSMRKGTPAAKMPNQVTADTKNLRSRQMTEVAEKNAMRYASLFLNEKVDVLFEEATPSGGSTGHTGHYLRVEVAESIPSGVLAQVQVEDIHKKTLLGHYVKEETQ